ncbi:MAG TPA: hypothetical protein VNT04_03210, partial [Gaiellaceae bacterium]|nr:hypothetical protein [Gaiellaceae bacterium]
MARRRASMREGPLAELFRATEAAQRQAEKGGEPAAEAEAPVTPPPDASEPLEETVEHVPEFAQAREEPPIAAVPEREPEAEPVPEPEPERLAEPEPAADEEPEPEPVRLEPVPEPPPMLQPLPEPPPRLHRVPRGETAAYLAVIKVVGVGGAGLNALDRMMDAGIAQVEFVAVNTDIQQLRMSDAPLKIHIGRELTEGLGSG